MANQWLRLWHDMPNDPKWRTIARASKQPISLVQAVYLHLLVDASRNVTRGHVDVTNEDLASALDVTEDAVSAIREAMQSRVLDGDRLSGWELRQPVREDSGDPESGAKSSAERKRAERERKALALAEKEKSHGVTECHEMSRNVTLDKDKEEIKNEEPTVLVSGKPPTSAEPISIDRVDCPMQAIADAWNAVAVSMPAVKPVAEWPDARKRSVKARWVDKLKLKKYTDRQTGVDYWTRLFVRVEESDFLAGRTGGTFTATLDWVMNPTNLSKIIENGYPNREKVTA